MLVGLSIGICRPCNVGEKKLGRIEIKLLQQEGEHPIMQLQDKRFGQYRLLRLLGSGGMGEVYLAHDEHLDRHIAIKMMRTDILLSSEAENVQAALHLFKREAQAIARLSHPHILPLYAYDETTVGTARLAYLIMPFCPDGSLSDWWKQREQSAHLPLQQVAALLHQAASALQCAHKHRIIHRDVKPANFLLRSSSEGLVPDLLLADFGIAHVADTTTSISFHIRGIPLYMAPEQWSGQPTFATDQYALAVMAYQMVTGQHPFQGGTAQMMYHHLHTPPPTPSRVEPTIPPALDKVILKALEKDAGQRFPRILDFSDAFEQGLKAQKPAAAPTAIFAHTNASLSGQSVPSPDASVSTQQQATPISPVMAPTGRSQHMPSLPGNRNVQSAAQVAASPRRTKTKQKVLLVISLLLALGVVATAVFTAIYYQQQEVAKVAAANSLYQKIVRQPPALVYSLHSNSSIQQWDENDHCQFVNGGHRVSDPSGNKAQSYCSSFLDLATGPLYQVTMTRIAGDCGGINIGVITADPIRAEFSGCKDRGAGVTCTLAVLFVNNTTVMTYINGQYFTTYKTATSGPGLPPPPARFISFLAETGSIVLFKDLKMWSAE